MTSFWVLCGLVGFSLRRKSDISFKKSFCLMDIRPQDLLSREPTLCFRRHQLMRQKVFLNEISLSPMHKCRSMKMRVLEIEWTRLPHLKLAT